LRNFLKGWGRNIRGECNRKREDIMRQIQEMDESGVNDGHNQDERLKLTYQLEEELEKVMEAEEIYLKQRGGGKWTLEGDGNTKFAHLMANGRRRKKLILSLENHEVSVTSPGQIHEVIYGYYKNLFGKHPAKGVKLGGGLGDRGEIISGRQCIYNKTFHGRRGEEDCV
jgi:hypothetical protein